MRRNGALTLSLSAPSDVGLPYGALPRLLLSWLTTEAVRTRERTVLLGPTLWRFMVDLGGPHRRAVGKHPASSGTTT